jgi:hypothetical protein
MGDGYFCDRTNVLHFALLLFRVGQNRLNLRNRPLVIAQFIYNPIDQALKQLGLDRPTGFADGPQRLPSPVMRTTLVQGTHSQTGRCVDEIHVAGLPLTATHLTVSQAQPLLAVPMKGLGSCPTMAVD